MKVTSETTLRSFEFWAGAKDTAERLTADQLDAVECCLEEVYPDGCSETDINDIFWFETDWIAEMLGYEDWEALEAEA